MAITNTALTAFATDTDATSFVTASITPTTNRLALAWVLNDIIGGTPNVPTLTGCNLTWVLVDGFTLAVDGTIRLNLFRALSATPTTGAVTIDCGGQSTDLCIALISEFDGITTGGTNGSAAIVQVAHAEGTGTTALVTLAAFASALNGTAAGMFAGGTATVAPGSGFTEIHEATTTVTARIGQSEWRADNDTTADMTWTGSTPWGIIGVELAAASSVAGGWSLYRPYALGSALAGVTTGGLFYYWRRRKQEKPDE